jgi:hypothetical protein
VSRQLTAYAYPCSSAFIRGRSSAPAAEIADRGRVPSNECRVPLFRGQYIAHF